jgi:ATP-dependent DNA ligase
VSVLHDLIDICLKEIHICQGTAFRIGWLHEIKHDGFRILAWRDAKGVRLITRNGRDTQKEE